MTQVSKEFIKRSVTSKESQKFITKNNITTKNLRNSLKLKISQYLRALKKLFKRDLTRDSVIITRDVSIYAEITHFFASRGTKIGRKTKEKI